MIILNAILSEDNSTVIFVAFLGIFGGVAGNFIVEKIRNKFEKEKLKINGDQAQTLQIDNFYRSVSTKKVEDMLSEWMDLIANTESIKNKKTVELNGMLKDIMVYGSNETIRIAGIFQQYNYQNKVEEKNNGKYELLFISAFLLASIKYDFTGYRVDPIDLLKMKIKDISDPSKKKQFDESLKYAKHIIDKGL